MAYLFESKLPENKSIHFALKYVFGIGKKQSVLICHKLGFSSNLKVKSLSEDQISQIIKVIDSSNLILANDLKKFKLLVLKRLVLIKSYRGLRRKKGLPVRGQRTHTNAKTARKIR